MHDSHRLLDATTVDTVRAHASEAERRRRLPDEVLAAINRADLFRALVPASLGGLQLELPDALRLFEVAARVDGNFGWAVTIGAGGGVFAALLPEPTAREHFARPGAVVAGSGAPSGTARRGAGGYRIDGRWQWCSGAPHASLFTFGARIDGGDRLRAFALPPDSVSVTEDWDGFGLTATASHTVEVEDRFVPDDHTFEIGAAPWCEAPLYRFAFRQFAETSFAAVVLGLAGGFLDAADAVIDARQDEWSRQGLRLQTVRLEARKARARLELARDGFHAGARACWRQHCTPQGADAGSLQRLSLLAVQGSHESLACAQALYPYLGMAAVRGGSMLNRAWRDLHTASQHVMISPLQFAG